MDTGQGGSPAGAFDAFLSYSRRDTETVERIARELRALELHPFLDRWHLAAGQSWPKLLEKRLADCRSVVIFIGPEGLGAWQQREQYKALDRQANQPGFAVIPVLLPGVDDPALGFLGLNTWIDLRSSADDPAAIGQLAGAIRGEAPGVPGERPDPRAEICPYRGLQPFREEDAAFFFGREAFTDQLVEATREHGFFAVVGASGSGKSSVARAGLIPRLRRSEDGRVWDILSLMPGERPLIALFAAFNPAPADLGDIERLAWLNQRADLLRDPALTLGDIVKQRLAKEPGTDRLFLLVDQWEELYTLAQPREAVTEDDRRRAADAKRFVDLLLEATAGDVPLTVAATLRGDFYGHAVADRALADRLQGAVVNIGPPLRHSDGEGGTSELERIVRSPAEAVGLGFQEGLVQRILDAVGQAPGNLPLLEFLLTELWKRRVRGDLTHDAYEAVGGVEGAIAASAKLVFDDLKRPEQKAAARRLFLSLVTPGEGREDTRARATLPDDPLIQEVVGRFAGPRARLLVTNDDPSLGRTVEVSHEALIRHWQDLKDWIEANRKDLRIRERLRQRMAEWQDKEQNSAFILPPGLPLEEGRQLLDNPGDVPVDDLRLYIETSLDAEHKRQTKIEADQKRELQREQRLRKRTQVALVVATLFAVIAGGAGWLAYQGEQRAQGETARALDQESRALAAVATRAIEDGDAVTGMLLALRGLALPNGPAHRPHNNEAATAAADGLWAKRERRVLNGHEGSVEAVAFSPNGGTILTGSNDNTTRLWDAQTGDQRGVLKGHEWGVNAVAFSPDGKTILTGSDDRIARLWDAQAGDQLRVLDGHEGGVWAVAFSPDGKTILTGAGSEYGEDKTAKLWDAQTGDQLRIFNGHEGGVTAVAFSSDGKTILTGSEDKTARLWDVGQDFGAFVRYACARLPRDLTTEQMDTYGIDPDADWPCRERAQSLWPHTASAE